MKHSRKFLLDEKLVKKMNCIFKPKFMKRHLSLPNFQTEEIRYESAKRRDSSLQKAQEQKEILHSKKREKLMLKQVKWINAKLATEKSFNYYKLCNEK
jgi:hypothetical protein